jgi:hypothetical protein
MRAASIESTVLWMRQRASQGVAVAALVGRAVAVAAVLAVGARDGVADGTAEGDADEIVLGAGVGDAAVVPAQPARRTTRRPLMSAR